MKENSTHPIHRKFTLVELLVVISIFGILISLLQPSLVSIVSNSQKLECSQNLRLHAQAIHMYADDHDDYVNLTWIAGTSSQKHVFDKPIQNSDGSYRNNVTGLFNDGKRGYLEDYLPDQESVYVCPGSKFEQGAESFSNPGGWIQRTGTYVSTTRITWMHRKRQDYYIFSKQYDERNGWDRQSQKVMLYDPIRQFGSWSVSGGRYDLEGAIIHNNAGQLPVLMSDGHVLQFDRLDMNARPTLQDLIDRIYEQI